jgi:hypothetical protein
MTKLLRAFSGHSGAAIAIFGFFAVILSIVGTFNRKFDALDAMSITAT